MKANTARMYARKMQGKFPQFAWEVVRLVPYSWIVRGYSGTESRDYDILDCVVNC